MVILVNNFRKMDGKTSTEQEEKPFSVLEKFRQLKKDKEQTPISKADEAAKTQESQGGTVFQTSGSSAGSSEGDFGRGGFRGRGYGRFGGQRGKRSYGDSTTERPSQRIAADLWIGQKETDVAITEFVRSGPGFDVILKHRYTDFHVNEIDTEGNVIKLTSTEIPTDTEDKIPEELQEENPNILNPEQWAALKEIVENKTSETVDKDVTDLSKEERQRIHKAIKMRFGVYVYSNTLVEDGRKIMKIGYGAGNSSKQRWPGDRPEYLHFVVLKENCETSEAVYVLSRYTRIKLNHFSYAGTKDKRAVTTQQMCLRRTEAKRFQSCQSLRAIYLGNFSYKWKNLRLGDLSGNRFTLVLRNVKASDEVIEEAVDSLKKNGFINYFGMQRFGQSALVPTHLVGQAILKGDWKLATELILKPRPGEASFRDVKEARDIWWETRDVHEALKCLVKKEKSIEGKILTALKKLGPNAYQNAFDSLPRHTVTLYLHAYQSLVWNRVVSRRIRQYGLRVLPGDLVTRSRDADTLAYRWQEKARESDSSGDEEDSVTGGDGCKIQVQVLSAAEAESASVYDVVYPLPGDGVRLPDNETAAWYTEFLTADGFDMSAFGRVNKKYGMYGTYRKMLEKVEDLSWYIRRYSDPDEDLLYSDVDRLMGKPPLAENSEGPYRAIIVAFNLKTCCYATMAVRELTKCETSVVCQANLTNQAREEDLANKKLKREETSEKMELDSEFKSNPTNNMENNGGVPNNDEVPEGLESAKMEVEETVNQVETVNKLCTGKLQTKSEDNVNCDNNVLNGCDNDSKHHSNNALGNNKSDEDLNVTES